MKRYKVKRCSTNVPECILGKTGMLLNISYLFLLQFDFKSYLLHNGFGKGKSNQCYWVHKRNLIEVKDNEKI